jgi:uncharacterized protein
MSTRDTPWPAGTPCWADLMTTDREASWTFYSDVLGWQITDSGPEMGHYGMASVDGAMVAGIGTPPDPTQAPPPAWTTYLASDDLDTTCKAVTANGGQIAMPPMDVGGSGRMALAADPTGAFFGIWQKLDFIGAGRVNEPGAMVWNQAMSGDPGRARDFYTAVFGYTYTQMEGGDDFTTIDGDGPGNTIGGIGALDEIPAHWDTFFMVADADQALAKTTAAGGTIQVPAFDTPVGRMAALQDPQGATLWIMQDTSGMLDPATE